MGEKKRKEASVANWKKALAVIAGVLFVVLMIVSSMGSSWISSIAAVKPGDAIVIDYTIYDALGKPIVTTNQQLYTQYTSKGNGVLFAKQLLVTANQSQTKPIYPVQVYTPSTGWDKQFAIFNSEFNAISSGIVGMKVNEQKKISIAPKNTMTQLWSPEQLQRNRVNLSDINIGDQLAMGVSDNPEEMITNSSITYIRLGEVTNKSVEGVLVDFGYPTVDVTVVKINNG